MRLKDLLLPTIANDHTPHLLQKVAVVAMGGLILLSFAAVNLQALLWQSSAWLVGTVLPAVVIDLTNQERAELVAPALKRNSLLDEAAKLKAEHMAANQYFAHHSPDGISPWYWFDQVGYQYAHAGENLAIHFTDSSAVVEAWMQSPAHRENIVSEKYTEIGVGTAKGTYEGYETVYVVQLFGTPAAALQPHREVSVPMVVTSAPTSLAVAEVEEPVLVPQPAKPRSVNENEMAELEGPISQPKANNDPAELAEPQVESETVSEVTSSFVEPLPPESLKQPIAETTETGFSTYLATSSGLLPATTKDNISGTTAPYASFAGSLATRPSALLQVLYLLLGGLVATLLLTSIVLGIRQERPLQVVYGIGLLLLMTSLFYVHTILTASAVIAAPMDYVSQPLSS